jgi:hypothetical protein
MIHYFSVYDGYGTSEYFTEDPRYRYRCISIHRARFSVGDILKQIHTKQSDNILLTISISAAKYVQKELNQGSKMWKKHHHLIALEEVSRATQNDHLVKLAASLLVAVLSPSFPSEKLHQE